MRRSLFFSPLLLKAGLEISPGKLGLHGLKGALAAAAELGESLDEVSKLRTLLVSGAGILPLGTATRSFPTSAASSDLDGLLPFGFWF